MKNHQIRVDFSLQLTSSQKQKIDFLLEFFKPYTRNIYIVGGFLRDNILGIYSDDIDIELYDIDATLFYQLMKELNATELSKEFFAYCYDGIDILLPRIEIKTATGYHGFKMTQTNDPFLATQRRDFTINTLMYHLGEKKLYDFCNGYSDLQNKILRVVNTENFYEDNVRFLRAIRFMNKYHLKPDKETQKILLSMTLQDITKTKIEKELKKIFL